MDQVDDARGARQLPLDLPHVPALGADDFMISACNEEAMRLVESWPGWTSHAHLITGPAGAGKSHLVNVWRQRSGACVVQASDVTRARLAGLADIPLAVENIDRGPLDEQALFHLLNLARERYFSLLLSARTDPGGWRIRLPDLRSRLRALPITRIAPPDDALLGAVLIKLFADRQLVASPALIDFLTKRTERSIAAAERLVARLDRAALAERRKITPQFAARFLSQLKE